jgi:hypothetical protein
LDFGFFYQKKKKKDLDFGFRSLLYLSRFISTYL